MNSAQIITALVGQETLLEKKRTVALARQQWATVIELEAKIEYSAQIRKLIAEQETVEKTF